MQQTTLRNSFSFSGIGLHTGLEISVEVRPTAVDSGISFVRRDQAGARLIRAHSSNVVATSYATTLGVDGITVSTVEHILAALYGMGIDNAVVDLDGPEVPIMDGSSAHFVELIEEAGIVNQDKARKYLVVTEPIRVKESDKSIDLLPADDMELTIDYRIDFAHPFLTRQSFSGPFSREIFINEVVKARTFGFLKDIEMLKANGLAKGGCLSNAIVIGEDEILNKEGLRYPDELVRHKVLDLMGDLALLGAPVIGKVSAYRSGHRLNHRLTREVLKHKGRWKMRTNPAAPTVAEDEKPLAPLLLDSLAPAS